MERCVVRIVPGIHWAAGRHQGRQHVRLPKGCTIVQRGGAILGAARRRDLQAIGGVGSTWRLMHSSLAGGAGGGQHMAVDKRQLGGWSTRCVTQIGRRQWRQGRNMLGPRKQQQAAVASGSGKR